MDSEGRTIQSALRVYGPCCASIRSARDCSRSAASPRSNSCWPIPAARSGPSATTAPGPSRKAWSRTDDDLLDERQARIRRGDRLSGARPIHSAWRGAPEQRQDRARLRLRGRVSICAASAATASSWNGRRSRAIARASRRSTASAGSTNRCGSTKLIGYQRPFLERAAEQARRAVRSKSSCPASWLANLSDVMPGLVPAIHVLGWRRSGPDRGWPGQARR